MLNSAYRLLDRWAELAAMGGLVLLVCQCSSIVLDVMLRWLAGKPLHGLADLNQISIAVSVSAFLPLLLVRRANITIGVSGRFLGERANAWLDAFGHFATLAFVVIVAWQTFRHAVEVADHVSPIVEIPIAPVWWIAAAIVASCVPIQLVVLLLDIRQAVAHHGRR